VSVKLIWPEIFRLLGLTLRVEFAPMVFSDAKDSISHMPFCVWCVGVALRRDSADRAVREKKKF
jgi:hypothetical protein